RNRCNKRKDSTHRVGPSSSLESAAAPDAAGWTLAAFFSCIFKNESRQKLTQKSEGMTSRTDKSVK
ncbi:MAG: hypothetical protein ACK56I_14245, partial [bacterium]